MPPPAESPAMTMCAGLTGRWEAVGGGLIRYMSEEAAVSKKWGGAGRRKHTCCYEVLQGTRECILGSEPVVYGFKGRQHDLAPIV